VAKHSRNGEIIQNIFILLLMASIGEKKNQLEQDEKTIAGRII
jgi:hypothetical protein